MVTGSIQLYTREYTCCQHAQDAAILAGNRKQHSYAQIWHVGHYKCKHTAVLAAHYAGSCGHSKPQNTPFCAAAGCLLTNVHIVCCRHQLKQQSESVASASAAESTVAALRAQLEEQAQELLRLQGMKVHGIVTGNRPDSIWADGLAVQYSPTA